MKKTWSQTSSEVGRGAGSTSHLLLPKAMARVKKIILFQRSVPSPETGFLQCPEKTMGLLGVPLKVQDLKTHRNPRPQIPGEGGKFCCRSHFSLLWVGPAGGTDSA